MIISIVVVFVLFVIVAVAAAVAAVAVVFVHLSAQSKTFMLRESVKLLQKQHQRIKVIKL